MATLALGLAGAGIGAVTGVGAGAGWLLGTTLGRVMFPEKGSASSATRLTDLNVTGASYGAAIPRLYGTMRLAGNIIWAGELRSEAVTSSSGGGKGGAGGSSQVTGYNYFTSFAVAICEGEVSNLLKIWADGEVIYDAGAEGDVIASDVRFRFYPGDEEQLPDSIIEAAEGEDNTPAYRGLCYLVFDDLPLRAFGNRIPNIEVLVTTDGIGAYPLTDSEIASVNAGSFAYDAERGLVYSYEVVGGVDTVRKIDALTLDELATAEVETEFPRLPDAAIGFSRDRKGNFWIGTGAALLAGRQIHHVNGETMQLNDSADLPSGVGAITHSTDIINPLTGAQFQVAGSQQNYQVVIFDGALEVVDSITTSSRVSTGAVTDADEVAWVAMSGWATGPVFSDLEIVRVSVFGSPGVSGTEYSVESEIFTIATADLTPLGGTGSETNNITRLVAYLPASDELLFQNDYRILKWSTRTHEITASRDVSDLSGSLSLVHTHNGSEIVFISAGRYAVYLSAETLAERERVDLYDFDGVSASVNGVYDAATDSMFVFNSSFGVKRLFLRRASGAGAELADIVSDLCELGRLTETDVDVSALAGSIPGYLVSRPMSIAEALTPLSDYAFFDAVESGDVLKFLPRNQADSGVTITDEEMIAPPALRRLQESELPERISLSYLASDAGYQIGTQMEKRAFRPVATMFGRNQIARDLPMALTADLARQAAAKTLYSAWAERQTVSASLPLKYLALDPADVLSLEINGAASSARLMQSHFGADMTIETEAVTLSPLSYDAGETGDAGSGYEQVLIRKGSYAELFLLDLPLLRDQDATAGNGSRFYFAMDGYQSGWTGGTLYSAFDEDSYQVEGAISNEAVWGVTLTALADTEAPFQTDESSTLDIRFVSGGDELESINTSALLNGGNALLVGAEIIQFADVSENADGSYRLSTLLRGRRGTEGATGSHRVGERAILLRSGDIGGGFTAINTIDMPRRWKAVVAGRLIEEVSPTIKALTGNDLKPYAPVHITGERDGGDLSLSWQRRTRVGGGSLSGGVPLSEASERYELVFPHNGESVSKYVSDATEYIYELADFNADFGVSEVAVPELSLTLYQLSETIGRGFPATEII